MTSHPSSVLRVIPVVTREELNQFISLPWSIYGDDPHWVPPLKSDVRNAFDHEKHPFHRHSEAQPFLALRDSVPVGRICAIRNRNHETFHKEPVGFFGWFECVDDVEVAAALFDVVRKWLRLRDLKIMRGPTSFSTNETCSLLVDGEPGPPSVMMAYNPKYYPNLLQACGLTKVKDLYAWQMDDQMDMGYLLRGEKLVTRRYGITMRSLDMAKFDTELETVRSIYNAAWEKNWGFVPMTDGEIDHMAAELKPILEPKLALFVEDPDGVPIGFALALPDFNQVLKKMDGKLWPFGILKALIAKRRINWMRVIILGLVEEWRGKGIDVLLYLGMIRAGREVGITEGEQSWILEDNDKMNASIKRLGGQMYRTYRLYEIPL